MPSSTGWHTTIKKGVRIHEQLSQALHIGLPRCMRDVLVQSIRTDTTGVAPRQVHNSPQSGPDHPAHSSGQHYIRTYRKSPVPTGNAHGLGQSCSYGKDVSDQFHDKSCSDGVCLSAVLTKTDGMRDGNNVLYATANNEGGTASSARMDFDGAQPKENTGGIRTLTLSNSAVQSSDTSSTLPTVSSFLPPSIPFSTLIRAGASTSGNWIQIGSQLQLPIGDCASVYSVIALDRQTLQPKTSAPEISPRCFASSSTLVPYLQSLAGLNDLVIVGTLQGQQTDAGSFVPQDPSSVPFDASSIGPRLQLPGAVRVRLSLVGTELQIPLLVACYNDSTSPARSDEPCRFESQPVYFF